MLLDIELTAFDKNRVESFEAALSRYPEVVELHRLLGARLPRPNRRG